MSISRPTYDVVLHKTHLDVRKSKPDYIYKETWFHFHDKHYGNFYDMLLLAVDLPVMLVDHLERNPDTQLFRVKRGEYS